MHTYTEEQIALYVNGDMTGEELLQFEQTLLRDNSLQEDVQEFRNVLAALRSKLAPDAKDAALTQTLESFNEEYFGHKTRPVKLYIRWASVAAAVAIILVVTVFHPWRENDLYREYATMQIVPPAERGESTDARLTAATEAFNYGEFKKARDLFDKIHQQDPGNAMVSFYYAVSLIETDDQGRAVAILTDLYNGNSLFKYDAAYYLGLSYLKKGDKASCKDWMQKVPAGNTHYAQATSLLEAL
jgi:tetratricopeptide (TPR) repeat protein